MYGRSAESTSELRSQWMKVRLDDWMNGLIMDEITSISWPAIHQSELTQQKHQENLENSNFIPENIPLFPYSISTLYWILYNDSSVY